MGESDSAEIMAGKQEQQILDLQNSNRIYKKTVEGLNQQLDFTRQRIKLLEQQSRWSCQATMRPSGFPDLELSVRTVAPELIQANTEDEGGDQGDDPKKVDGSHEPKEARQAYESENANKPCQECESLQATLTEKIALQDKLERRLGRAIKERDDERIMRRAATDQAITLRGSIRVCIRPRPSDARGNAVAASKAHPKAKSQTPLKPQTASSVHSFTCNTVTLKDARKTYSFDRVFAPDCDHSDVWEELSPLVQSAIEGKRFMFCAFGETHSGKTYNTTLITKSILQQIYAYKSNSEHQVTVKGLFIDVYKDGAYQLSTTTKRTRNKILYLLSPADQVWVPHIDEKPPRKECTMSKLEDLESATVAMGIAMDARHKRDMTTIQGAVQGTNPQSSRGHFVAQWSIETANNASEQETNGVLIIVDLTGNEEMPTIDEAKQESQAVTTSLDSTRRSTLLQAVMSC
ncbi:P-loop containing nucleoside triphosphate hydrolase protein [Amniculicola lignicola CBS 123094]|uniref:P-loop containing nucleoside triphosphate hydrolase protein n=1 Tax=Amniculicola lignicola CBS 123094 TaxID=1392246 RepID=A0A6A5WF96_9PLEO|nr:P-loop containing nucleoside triphosphate hydrolase protein [Amniculicola lignicola CBS 123094]